MTTPAVTTNTRWADVLLASLGPLLWFAVSVSLIWAVVTMMSGQGDSGLLTFCEAQTYLNPLRHGPFMMAYLFLLPWLVVFILAAGVLLFLKRVNLRVITLCVAGSVLAWGLPILLSLTPLTGAYDRALADCIDTQREQAAAQSQIAE